MKKMPSVFLRDFAGDPSRVTRTVNPEAAWVAGGEGVATRKWDGTAMMLRGGVWFARFDVKTKNGFDRKAPPHFEPCQEPDANTGHWPGWIPVTGENASPNWFARKFLAEALANEALRTFEDGTYELCGPKLQTNPERIEKHLLIRHGCGVFPHAPRDFDGLAAWLADANVEGLVWRHPDGRMAKIKASDFGIERGVVAPVAAARGYVVGELMALVACVVAMLLALSGCLSPSAAHLRSDARFLDDVGRDAEGWYRSTMALPDGTIMTETLRQAKLDAIAAKRDELRVQAETTGVSLTAAAEGAQP